MTCTCRCAIQRREDAATGCTQTGRTRTREPNLHWLSCRRCSNSGLPKIPLPWEATPSMNNPPLPLFQRHNRNPILSAADWPYQINSVFNPGAILLKDGTTLLMCRVEDRRGHSHLTAARSANGVDGWKVDPQPTLKPEPDRWPEELWGVEDPRVTFVPELDRYAVVYTA